MTQVKNEVQQGWEFATKIAGADIAAHLGSGYVGEVEEAIAELTRQIVKLKSNQSDAVLGGYIAESGKTVILDDTAEMMKNSVLYNGAPEVSKLPALYTTEIAVCEEETVAAGKKLADEGCNPVLLSFANRSTPGWGVRIGYPSQENSLLRRSDLFASIFQFDKSCAEAAGISCKSGNQYPMDRNVGGLYSPGVTFFSRQKRYRIAR